MHNCLEGLQPAALQGAGVPVQELDWMVCNGGAGIWQLLQSRDGKDPTWSSDEHWDAHITFRHASPLLCHLNACVCQSFLFYERSRLLI